MLRISSGQDRQGPCLLGADISVVGKNPADGFGLLFILLFEPWRELLPELGSFQVRGICSGMVLFSLIVISQHQEGKRAFLQGKA